MDDAHSLYGYEDDTISGVLEAAFPRILDITSGLRPCPVLEDFKSVVGRSGNQVRRASEYHDALQFPVLPADRSLIEPFSIRLQQALSERLVSGHALPIGDPALLATSLGTILFSIAILRHYLERPPEDDVTIYALITGTVQTGSESMPAEQRPRIVRRLTVPEQALATALQLGRSNWTDPDILTQLMFEER